MGKCEDCRYLREYKIHKRIINYHPETVTDGNGIKRFNAKNGIVYVGRDWKEFEEVLICERLKCEPDSISGCELWEKQEVTE